MTLRAIACGDMPEAVIPDVCHLVDYGAGPAFACFACPCGNADCPRIVLPLSPVCRGHGSMWTLKLSGGDLPTIEPSIDRTNYTDCKSHFFVKAGEVERV